MPAPVYILSACRTPIGNLHGQFEKFSAADLGSFAISEAISRAHLLPQDINEVIIGQVLTAGQGQNPARQAAVLAKIPYSVPAFTINMLCGSGLKSLFLAYQAIKNQDSNIVIAGGQENMTKAHHTSYLRGTKLASLQLQDSIISDGLTDAFHKIHMGQTAEHLVTKYTITRQEQDQFALESQTKAQEALRNGHFKREIVPVKDPKTGKNIELDEFPKSNTTIEGLLNLRPVFKSPGSVTAGNSSGINDGAAMLLLCSKKEVDGRKLKPLAEIIAFGEAGVDPMMMGLGVVDAVEKVVLKAGWTKESVDLFELNEAFAVQSLLVVRLLGLERAKVNVSGGAIALGHPIGASGARVLVTLIHNLKRLNKKRGVAGLCIGGGMGIAVAIEMCD